MNPVLFEEASSLIPSNAVIVEIAPHGLMQAVLKRSHKECTHIPLTRRGEKNGVNFLLNAIGKLYNAGFNPRLETLYPTVAFPVSTETPLLSHLVQWEHSEDWPLVDTNNEYIKPIFRDVVFSLHDDDYKYLEGHIRNGVIALPDAALLKFVWETLAMYKGTDFRHQSVVFSDIQFLREIILPVEASVRLTVSISKGNESFEVMHENKLIVSGNIKDVKFLKFHQATEKLFDDVDETNTGAILSTEDIYKILRTRGFDYKGNFQTIFSSNLNNNKALIKWNENWVPFLDGLIQLNTISKDYNGVLKPKFIRVLKISVLEQENARFEMKRGIKCYDAKVNKDCGVTRCAGVEIQDITFNEIPLNKNTKTILATKEFFPFYPTKKVDIKNATMMNLQIISENCLSKQINITKFVNGTIPIEFDYIDVVADKVFLENEKTYSIRTTKNELQLCKTSAHVSNATNVFVLQNILQSSKEIMNLNNIISQDTFVLSIEDKVPRLQSPLKDCFTIISCMSDGEKILILMKRICTEKKTYISICFDESLCWVSDVFDKLQTKKQIVLISEKQNNCGISGMVKHLKSEGYNNISAVIIDDACAPKFDPNHDFYKEQMQKNMTFNILKKGEWGSFYFKSSNEFVKQSSFALKDESEGNLKKLSWTEIPKTDSKTSVQVSYSGLSNSYLYRQRESDKQFSSIGFDFSGINRNGVKVMGLVAGGSVSTSVEADPHLTWPVPEHWTLEDAATVPAAFVQAYYCLRIRSQIERGKSVMILDGPSDVGLALISLCTFYDCNIYTVVQTDYQKEALLMLHPQLNENNIILSENDGFYNDIMSKTKGQGCDYVINFEAGDIREAAARCVGFFGHFLDFSKNDMYENKTIGMAFLVQSRSYRAVDPINLFRTEYSGDRKRLQNYITQGIISGAVKPLSRVLYSPLQMEEALTLLSRHKYIGKVLVDVKHTSVANGLDTVPRLQYTSHDVVVVICDGNGVGVKLTDQLIERGARNFLLYLKTRPSGYYLAKFAAWRKREVSLKLSEDDVQTMAGTEALLKNAESFGKIKGIFVVFDAKAGNGKEDFVNAFKTHASVVMNLDVASRKAVDLSHFVILSPDLKSAGDASALCLAERVCDTRNEMGLTSLVLRHHSLTKLNGNLTKVNNMQPQMIAVLFNAIESSLKLKHRSVLFVELKEDKEEVKKEETTTGISTFYQHVDTEEDYITSQDIVELPTLYHDGNDAEWNSKDPYIILIPGFEGRPQILESVAERLKLRAISVKLGPDMEGDSIQEIAYHARKQLKCRFGELKREKFYVLGYSFGANVALELAAILEKEGHIGVVHCVDGSPDAMKVILDVVFNNIPEENLQDHVFNHMNKLITEINNEFESDLETLDNKHENVKKINENVNYSIQYKKCVLESAYKRIAMVREYNTTIKLKSVVVLMKSSIHLNTEIVKDDYGLSKYTEQPVKIFKLTADHATALQDNRVSNIVNMFADTNVITNNESRHEA